MAMLPKDKKDFRVLRNSGNRNSGSWAIGMGFVIARTAVARVLVKCGVTPNGLTVAGFGFTLATAGFLAAGASDRFGSSALDGHSMWTFWAGVMLFMACACDMLDGAVAREADLSSEFGAIFDSVVDRLSDLAIYIGIAAHFAARGNLTYTLLAMIAMSHTVLISYVKARAEDTIDDCSVGWWQRGERHVSILICCYTGHIPLLLWQQGILPVFTVWRRLDYTRRVLKAQETGGPMPRKGPLPGAAGLIQPWRYPRGSWPFDCVAAVNITLLIVGPWVWPFFYGDNDPVRVLIAWLFG